MARKKVQPPQANRGIGFATRAAPQRTSSSRSQAETPPSNGTSVPPSTASTLSQNSNHRGPATLLHSGFTESVTDPAARCRVESAASTQPSNAQAISSGAQSAGAGVMQWALSDPPWHGLTGVRLENSLAQPPAGPTSSLSSSMKAQRGSLTRSEIDQSATESNRRGSSGSVKTGEEMSPSDAKVV